MNKKTVRRGLAPYLLIFVIMIGILYFINLANVKVNYLSYDEFMTQVNKGKVTEMLVFMKSLVKLVIMIKMRVSF